MMYTRSYTSLATTAELKGKTGIKLNGEMGTNLSGQATEELIG